MSLPSTAKRTAASQLTFSFFTGGVDSFYTALNRDSDLTALTFVHGFDVDLKDQTLADIVESQLEQAAARMGKRLIKIRTNLREISDQFVPWNMYHGPALASVALALSPHFSTSYIPSTHSYRQLFPWGSHPILDHLWSTEAVSVVHDGAALSRFDKIRKIAQNPIVQSFLRVCFINKMGKYNCEECEKCVRTKVALHAVGLLPKFKTFQESLDINEISKLLVKDSNQVAFIQENIEELENTKDNAQLISALKKTIFNYQVAQLASSLDENATLDPQIRNYKKILEKLFLLVWRSNKKYVASETVKESLKSINNRSKSILNRMMRDLPSTGGRQTPSSPNGR